MAGHSKWKNIQHRKGRQDAKKAKIFTKISKEIFAAVKNGGDDPEKNTTLRLALQKAKQANIPADNIERTIKKATGDLEGVTYEEITYEGYGPHGVAMFVDVLTDNRNRAAAEVRHMFNKHNGNLGESGCVAYLFERKGVLMMNASELNVDEDEFMLEAVEAGAEDVDIDGDTIQITTDPTMFEEVKKAIDHFGVHIIRSELTRVPQTTIALNEQKMEDVLQLIDDLEDSDDVQQVHANLE